MADVKKSAFVLSSATVMLGKAFVDDVFSLTPAEHSVGMVSEVAVPVESQVTELLNGVSQSTVDAVRTGVTTMITANVYEMTAQNAMRGHSLSGQATPVRRGILSAAAAAGAVSLSVNSDPIPGESTSAITNLSEIPAGSTVLLQRPGGESDYVFPTKTSAAATGTGPFTLPIAAPYAIPANMSFPAGTRVWIIQPVLVGNIDADDLFCVKVTGKLSQFDRPLTFVAPKVRMVKGFGLSFNETQHTSMAWEMKPLLMTTSEVSSHPRFPEIGTRGPGLLYVGG
jgi:hypothetical protein